MTALIPIIRRVSPRTKIVFRSHIQIRADLIDKGDKQIKATWDYLWSFIRQADVFVAHPVEEFVPKVVRENMPVVFMPRASSSPLALSSYSPPRCPQSRPAHPWRLHVHARADLVGRSAFLNSPAASTDPIDGLNKPLSRLFLEGYRHTFEEAVRVRRRPLSSPPSSLPAAPWSSRRSCETASSESVKLTSSYPCRALRAPRSTGTAATSCRSPASTRPRSVRFLSSTASAQAADALPRAAGHPAPR